MEYNKVELSKNALFSNIDFIKGIIPNSSKISVVIKSNAYGHGIKEILSLCEEYNIEYYCVFSFDEAMIIRSKGVKKPVLILGYISPRDIEAAIKNDIRITVFNIETLIEISKTLKKLKNNYIAKIHLKIETGTNRLGICSENADKITKHLINEKRIEVEGALTHFANIEDTTDHSYAKFQIKNFKNMINYFEKSIGKIPIKHCACSAAAFLFSDSEFNMIRFGISLYGLWSSKETYLSCILKYGRRKVENGLKPVLTWKSVVAQVKTVKKGSYIGYGCTYKTTRDSIIAVIPIGYSDGYARLSSGRTFVLINGQRAPIRGRICMNLMMADISDIENVTPGSEVVLIGKQESEEITAEDLAMFTDTINYEVVTRISPHLKREIIY